MQEEAGPKRVDLLYLADSILQNCRNSKLEGCGPDSKGAQAFPRVIAAALPALITAVAEDPVGAEKAEKVRPSCPTPSFFCLQATSLCVVCETQLL